MSLSRALSKSPLSSNIARARSVVSASANFWLAAAVWSVTGCFRWRLLVSARLVRFVLPIGVFCRPSGSLLWCCRWWLPAARAATGLVRRCRARDVPGIRLCRMLRCCQRGRRRTLGNGPGLSVGSYDKRDVWSGVGHAPLFSRRPARPPGAATWEPGLRVVRVCF